MRFIKLIDGSLMINSVQHIVLRIYQRKKLDFVELGHSRILKSHLKKRYFRTEIIAEGNKKIGYFKAEVSKKVIQEEELDDDAFHFLIQSFPDFHFTRLNKTIDWHRLVNTDMKK